jgi:hypothetical protein
MNKENFDKASEIQNNIYTAEKILKAASALFERANEYGGNPDIEIKAHIFSPQPTESFSITSNILIPLLKKYATAEIKRLNTEFTKL